MSTVDKDSNMSPEKKDDAFMDKSPTFNFSDPNSSHDRILLVEEKKFYVLSGVLIAWTDYFKGLFGTNFKESDDKEIEIKDVTAEDFENFLQIVYPSGKKVTETIYLPIIELAHRFLAPAVLVLCREFITKEFAELDKMDLLEIAIKLDMNDLKDKVANFVVAEEIPVTVHCADKDCGDLLQCTAHSKRHTLSGYAINKNCYLARNEKTIDYLVSKKPTVTVNCADGCANNTICTAHNTHITMKGYAINKNCYLAKNYERASALSSDAKAFLLDEILDRNYQID